MLVGIIFTCDNIYMKADTYLEDRLDTLIDSMKNSQSSERGVLLQLEDQSDLTDFDIEIFVFMFFKGIKLIFNFKKLD